MLRCSEVTRLCASEDLQRAPLRTRIAVRVHLMMCRFCRRYVKELALIGHATRGLQREVPDEVGRHEALIRRVLPDTKPPKP
jgi:hypothetical protein